MIKIGDYNKIVSDRNIFNQVVYTPLSEALKILEERRKDKELMAKVEELLEGEVPEFFKHKKCGILSRHIATPNHESLRFISVAQDCGLVPVFFEYHDDKFTSNNDFKHSLGQLHVQHKKCDKNGGHCMERMTIVDFNSYNGKRLKDVKTLWAEPLVDFHRKLFSSHKHKSPDLYFYNASEWFQKKGGRAGEYYSSLLMLFTCYGILFENFLIEKGGEGEFTEKIVLPAIEKVMNMTGVKPLIVPIEPIELEAENFWHHHLPEVKNIIPKN